MGTRLPATGVIWALRAQSRKKVRKGVPGASRPRGSKKSQTESKTSQNRLFFSYSDSFSTPFWTFWTPGAERPRDSFSDFFLTLGPKAPNDPCSRQTDSQRAAQFPDLEPFFNGAAPIWLTPWSGCNLVYYHATEGPRGDDPKNDLVLVVRFFLYV